MYPNFAEEKKLWKQGYKLVVGLDEAGRGPLAGPVVAAAVFVNLKFKNDLGIKIKDSKKLTIDKREKIYEIITSHRLIKWGVGIVSEKVIDKINILEATKLAMQNAILDIERKIKKTPEFILIDGNFKIYPVKYQKGIILPETKLFNRMNYKIMQKSIIKADEKVFSCSAAGIIAKVTRDRIMQQMHEKYPKYGFNKHKGYGTKLHISNLKTFGSCKIHRKSFFPVSIYAS